MQNQNIFYQPLFPQYNSDIYGRYNNFQIPNKYNSKFNKSRNFLFSSEEENMNSQGFYILTDKNDSSKNHNNSKRLIIDDPNIYSNSQIHIKEYKQLWANKKNEKNNKSCIKNDIKIAKNTSIPLNNNVRNIEYNSNQTQNICYNLFNKQLKANKSRKKLSNLVLGYYNEDNSFYNKNNNSYYCNNQEFAKYKSHSVLRRDYDKNNNNKNLNKEYNTKNEYREKSSIYNNKNDIKYDNYYKDGEFFAFNEMGKIYKNNFNLNTSRAKSNKINNNKDKNDVRCIYNNNNTTNLIKIVKNNNNYNNNFSNKKEIKSSKPQINENINYSKKIGSFDNIEPIKKKYSVENEQKISFNFSTNNAREMQKIKKMSLDNLPSNDYLSKNNHSFYEIKSLSKELSQKNLSPKNNNEVKSIICTKVKNNDEIIDRQNLIKNNSNTILIEDNYRKDNFKNEGNPYLLQKQISKSTFEASNKSQISINELKSMKENINLMNNNNLNYNNISFNNNYLVEDKIKKGIKIMKTARIKSKYLKNNIPTGKNNQINKNIKNKENNSKIHYEKNKKEKNRGYSISSHYIDNVKSVETKKIIRNYFSFFAISKSNQLNTKKKIKKGYSQKNLIQLMNINKKTYEEDFPIEEKNIINNLNKILRPQISFRIALFAKKEPENEKYFLVNKFCSENIRNMPDEWESDF